MPKKKVVDPAFEKLFEAWQKVAAPLYNKSYENNGPQKYEIEEMRTDREYEVRVVECVTIAWDEWEQNDKPDFSSLQQDQKERVVDAALDPTPENGEAEYGWYRGNLPELRAVRRALKEL